MSRTAPQGVELEALMQDPEFRRSVQVQLAAQGFLAQVRRLLLAQGVPKEAHARVLAKCLGWTERQCSALLKDANRLTVEHATHIAHAFGFRLRITMEP